MAVVGRASAALLLACVVGASRGDAELNLEVQPTTVSECVELVREFPDEGGVYRCFWMVARRHGVWDEAVAALERLSRDDPDDPRPTLMLAAIHSDLGDPRAEEFYDRAAVGFARDNDAAGEVHALIGLAFVRSERGRGVEAEPVLERALEVATRSEIEWLDARVLLASGWHASRQHDYAAARQEFESVEAATADSGPYDVQQGVLNGLGYVAWATGRYRSAIHYYRREAEVAAAAGDDYAEAGARYNAALMAESLVTSAEDRADLEAVYAESLDAAVRAGNRDLEARLRMMLAQPFDGDPGRIEQAERVLVLGEEMESEDLILQAMRGLAVHRFLAGDHDQGLATAQRAVNRARKGGFHYPVITGAIVVANLRWTAGPREPAIEASLQALNAIEELRDLQTAEEEQARIASRYAFAFYQFFGRLVEKCPELPSCDVDLAVRVMERLRAHTLLETFESAGADAVPPGVLERADEVSLAALQQLVREDEVLLSYQLSNRADALGRWQGGAWVVVVTHDDVRVHPLPDATEIDPAVDLFLGLVRGHQGELVDTAAQRLSGWLLGAALEPLGDSTRRLVVVPDGSLHGLPFAALPVAEDGEPLAASFAVSTAPSLAVWAHWRRTPVVERPAAVLGIADPAVGDDAGAEPAERGRDREQGPLPFARRETRRVCRRIGGNSRLVTGDDASKGLLESVELERYTVLHLATHAEVDAEDPAQSAVLLAPGDVGDDGRLGIADIVGLELDDALVVLASCRSATGVALQGEGVLGLTRAFLHAGSRAVVGALWPVDDRATARLVERFYRHLADGAPVAAALAAAQSEVAAAGAPPAEWAGMVVVGDGELTLGQVRAAWPRWWVLLGAAVIVLAIAATWRRCRRKTS